jgi:hypothetical protein
MRRASILLLPLLLAGAPARPDTAPRESAHLVTVPADTVTCSISAWSSDPDPHGLNMRSAPDAKAPVIARFVQRSDADGMLVEFSVIGFRGGWFLVERASYGDYGDPPPAVPLYAGKGWVHGSKLGGQLFAGRFHDRPDDAAPSRPYGVDTDAVQVRQLLACRGDWARVATDVGTGWVKGLCSNQVTTCV